MTIEMSTKREKVAAVVVTYNRLQLLQECIGGLMRQSEAPWRVIVVVNGSTDGTVEWLRAQPGIITLVQDNLGCAAGFARGIAHAHSIGSDWIWCMDDDGFPAPRCLEALLSASIARARCCLGPLVVAKGNPGMLAFSFTRSVRGSPVKTRAEAEATAQEGVIQGWCSFFNGVLLNVSVMESVGVPDARLFIWGDEIDYALRIAEAGFALGTVTSAEFVHPMNRVTVDEVGIIGRSFQYPVVADARRRDIALRNYVYIALKHGSIPHGIGVVLAYARGTWRHFGIVALYRYAACVARATHLMFGQQSTALPKL